MVRLPSAPSLTLARQVLGKGISSGRCDFLVERREGEDAVANPPGGGLTPVLLEERIDIFAVQLLARVNDEVLDVQRHSPFRGLGAGIRVTPT